MKCPACFYELTSITANGVTVDVCQGGCGGIWFDQFELEKFRDPGAAVGTLLSIPIDHTLLVDRITKRRCPRCVEVALKRRFSSRTRKVEIDECGGCGGIWLDAGELAKIREETREESPEIEAFEMAIYRYYGRTEPRRRPSD